MTRTSSGWAAALAFLLPLAAVAGPPADGPVASGSGADGTTGIVFQKGAAELGRQGEGQVNRLLEAMRGDPASLIRLRSHPDDLGSSAYEIAVQEKRLAAVRAILQAGGVPPARIRAEYAPREAANRVCLEDGCPPRLDVVFER